MAAIINNSCITSIKRFEWLNTPVMSINYVYLNVENHNNGYIYIITFKIEVI